MKHSHVTHRKNAGSQQWAEATPCKSLPLCGRRGRAARGGFTLVQLLVVLAILATLAAVLMSVMGRGRSTAQRAQCDMQIKAVAVALDAFRQENGYYPNELNELTTRKYLEELDFLRCPIDEEPQGGYKNYYVHRAPRNDPQHVEMAKYDPAYKAIAQVDVKSLPILVCPLHEADGHGVQAFAGTYTRQFATKPAVLQAANATQVTSPGQGETAGRAGMELHGGDLIKTGSSGSATVRFADGSTATLQGGTKMTVLQSFIQSQTSSSLYILLKQHTGIVDYVHHGPSKFDVSTPTATAGALGTVFQIKIAEPASPGALGVESWVCTQGQISCSTTDGSDVIPNNTAVDPGKYKKNKGKGKDKDKGNDDDDDDDDDD